MSGHVLQSDQDQNSRTARYMNTCQSAWIDRWTGRNYVTAKVHDQSLDLFEKGTRYETEQPGSSSALAIISGDSRPAKVTRTLELVDKSFKISSRDVKDGKQERQSLTTANLRASGGNSSLKIGDDMQLLGPPNNPNVTYRSTTEYTVRRSSPHTCPKNPTEGGTSSKEFSTRWEGHPERQKMIKIHPFFGDITPVTSTSLQENIYSSTSSFTRYLSDCNNHKPYSRRPGVISSKSRLAGGSKDNVNMKILDGDNIELYSNSGVLLCHEKLDNLDSGKSLTTLLRDKDMKSLPCDFSESNHQFPPLDVPRFYVKDYPSSSLFSDKFSHPEVIKSKKLPQGFCPPPTLPHSIHDVKTMKICTTVDTLAGSSGSWSRLSQKNRSLLITKETEVKLSEEKKNFGISKSSTELKGHAISKFYGLFRDVAHRNKGVKIQSLGSSTDSDGIKDVGDAEPSTGLKNESSVETDTMDMDALNEENDSAGPNCFQSEKVAKVDTDSPPQFTAGSPGEEVGRRCTNICLPDMSLELPALTAGANLMDGEPSCSKTQSLDMELLLAHAEQPSYSKSSNYTNCAQGPKQNVGWVKRLKLSASNSFFGTKSSNFGGDHVKRKRSFTKATSPVISEPDMIKHHAKEIKTGLDSASMQRNDGFSSLDTSNSRKELLKSHKWIQRWLCKRALPVPKKAEITVICEPQSSKLALQDLPKKECPSIAAMALMGKAMSGFQPCAFHKRGSLVVWNTGTF